MGLPTTTGATCTRVYVTGGEASFFGDGFLFESKKRVKADAVHVGCTSTRLKKYHTTHAFIAQVG